MTEEFSGEFSGDKFQDSAPITVVAMSGGVDSSVAALLLHQQGERVLGVSMQVWDYRQHGGSCSKATCCAPSDFNDARRVCAVLGVPYYVFDFEKIFRAKVIDRFVSEYQQGRTPNPCIECNSKVKFAALRERAYSFGAEAVATGHYAKIDELDGRLRLLRGKDREKDQSYFLYRMKPEELARTKFPLGDLTKPEVRELAKEAGFVTAEKPESQDICFVSGEAWEFVERYSGSAGQGGTIRDREGEVLGSHDGIHRFTVGQRRGIGIGGSRGKLYVLQIDPTTQEVVVGEKAELERDHFYIEDLSWVQQSVAEALNKGNSVSGIIQLRHRHEGVPVYISLIGSVDEASSSESLRAKVSFAKEWATVSPGQAAVLYCIDNQEVLGGGVVCR